MRAMRLMTRGVTCGAFSSPSKLTKSSVAEGRLTITKVPAVRLPASSLSGQPGSRAYQASLQRGDQAEEFPLCRGSLHD